MSEPSAAEPLPYPVLEGWHERLGDGLAEFYRDLHRHPELAFQEHRTAAKIAEALGPLAGVEVTTGVGGTGVVAVIGNGEGPVVMLRADIDALPVAETTGVPYASTGHGTDEAGQEVPVMHACGHDMHATCLLGAVTLLAGAGEDWAGTVVAVFQPAEETVRGARAMIDDGLFTRFPKPSIVLGQHVGPLPAGMLGYRSGAVMAAGDTVRVTLHGRGGHGGRPENTVDPVLLAASVVVRLQGIVSREIAPADTAVLTVGYLHAGTKENIIPDHAELGMTVRTYTPEVRDRVLAAIERIVRAEAAASGTDREPEIRVTEGCPVLVSDPVATERTAAVFAGHFGAGEVLPVPELASSEDVGNFGLAAGAPTVYWFWGGPDRDTVLTAFAAGRFEQDVPGNHSPDFAPVIEPTLTTGVEAMTVAALAWLE